MPPDAREPMVQQFRAKARTDLAAAELLATRGTEFDALVCFHSQQAVEKMLKAALLAWRVDPPRTHDVSYLLERLSGATQVSPELGPLCAQLADLGVAPRYPGWDPVALAVDAHDAIDAARRVLSLLESLLGPDQEPPAGDAAASK